MYQIRREKVNLSLEKKLWIIREIKSIKKFLNRDEKGREKGFKTTKIDIRSGCLNFILCQLIIVTPFLPLRKCHFFTGEEDFAKKIH